MNLKQSFSLMVILGAGFNITWINQGIKSYFSSGIYFGLFLLGIALFIFFSEITSKKEKEE